MWIKLLFENSRLFILANLSVVFQFFSNVILTRYMSSSDFGTYNAIISLISFTAILVSSFQYITAKGLIYYSDSIPKKNNFIKSAYTLNTILIIITSLIIIIFKNQILQFLQLSQNQSSSLYIFCAFQAINIYIMFHFGIYQGLHKYQEITFITLINLFIKLLLFIIFAFFFYLNIFFALVLALFSSSCALIWSQINLKKYFPDFVFYRLNSYSSFIKSIKENKVIYKQSIYLGLYTVIFNFLNISDVVFVKHFYTANETGIFSAMGLIAKTLIYIPTIFIQIIYSKVSANHKENKSSLFDFIFLFLITALINLILLLVVFIFPKEIIFILVGKKYINGIFILQILTLAMFTLSLLNVIFNFYLAKEKYYFLYVVYLITLLLVIFLLKSIHNSPLQIAFLFLYSFILMFILLFGQLIYLFRKEIKFYAIKKLIK